MDKPTVFLSSTIYDFRDLRSSLKDYIEQRGIRVLASEFNDFTKPLDKHSYEACLETIEQADLFILLIGSRVGGWVDESNKISITRSEYRRAYDLAKQGKLRLLSFVRSDVWNHRESVKQLRKYLKEQTDLSSERRNEIAHHPTGFMTDAEAIISFIDEVAHAKETVAASKGLGEAPVANWVHSFTNFSDIREAVDPLILRGLTVSIAAGRKALQSQLLVMMQGLLKKRSNSQPVYAPKSVRKLAKSINIKADDLSREVIVEKGDWTKLVSLSLMASGTSENYEVLLPALSSDLLLNYDRSSGRFEHTLEYDALTFLIDQARIFAKSGSPISELIRHGQAIDRQENRKVPAILLATSLQHLFRWTDLLGVARALARAMEGHPLELPDPMPRSPIFDQEVDLATEEVSLNDVRKFVGLPDVAGIAT